MADLDGDGTYEIMQMWSPSNAKDNSQSGYTGTVYVDAYRMDGTRLWRINMGPNIRAGAHYTQLLAYDFDGDGKAEVAMKTADGTRDAAGTVIGNAGADYRNSSGYVLDRAGVPHRCSTGPRAPSWTPWPTNRHAATSAPGATPTATAWTGSWAPSPTSTAERPSMMFSRGYYTRTVLAAYDLVDGKITKRWTFDSDIAGAPVPRPGQPQPVSGGCGRATARTSSSSVP